MKYLAVLTCLVLALVAGCSAAPKAPTAATIAVTITDTSVTPNGEQVKVRKDGTVTITVASTKADEIHVHGYDTVVTVEPGKPSSASFVADKVGTFEIETHETGTLLVQLVVEG